MVTGDNYCIIRCYGITKDPETNEFMMVMQYAQYGSLRQHLNKSFNLLSWRDKLYNLEFISYGLEKIHEKGLIHHDFHCGNILFNNSKETGLYSQITDLGLCNPANVTHQSGDKKYMEYYPM